MSEPWSQLSDVDRLADKQADVAFEIPLDQLPRVRAQLADSGGKVRGVAHFRREAGFRVATLDFEGVALLVCQRCLEPVQWPVAGTARVALIAAESEADRVPQEFETVHAPENRIRVRDLVEEELLLSLPLVPMHEDAGECAGKSVGEKVSPEQKPVASDEAPAPETQRPFERLSELLKRKS
ncbi:MAG TPA: YceD family protein [Steroidobacteraceae bacterium]|jgi:uncharacterized protein|nr:YceD family protein [Steroidobacteraceae bacterium]